MLADYLHGRDRRIGVTDIVKRLQSNSSLVREYFEQNCKSLVEDADVLQTILSTRLPPECFDGIISLLLVLRLNAPEKEIQEALVS